MYKERRCENCGETIDSYDYSEYFYPIEVDDITEEFLLSFIDEWAAKIDRELDSLDFNLPNGYSWETLKKLERAELKLRDFFEFDIVDKLSNIERIDMKNINKVIWNAREKIMDIILDDPIEDAMQIGERTYKEIFKAAAVCDKCKHSYWHDETDYSKIEKIQDIAIEKAINLIGGCKQYFPFLTHKETEIKTYWNNKLKIQVSGNVITSKRRSNIRKFESIEKDIYKLKKDTIYSILKGFDDIEGANAIEKFGKIISFVELKSRFKDVNLVSGDTIPFDGLNSYSDKELGTESDTHKNMRETSMKYFLEEGYDVCSDAIGVSGTYALVDFVITKNNEIIFVECLTDRSSTKAVIDRKMNLKKYGDICFVFVGGSGYSDFWVNDTHRLPDIIQNISDDVLIYLYYYGHWRNNFEKRIEEYYKPLTSKDSEICKKIEIKFDIDVKRKYCYITLNIPLQNKNRNRKYKSPINMIYNKSAFFRYLDRRTIRLMEPMKFKIRDKEGISHFENYIEKLSEHFTVIYNKDKIDEFKIKVENLPEQNTNKLTIESDMSIEGRIVWALYRLFGNKPTLISKLSDVIGFKNTNIQYYLNKGIKQGNLLRVGRGQYIATDKGIEEIGSDLNKEHNVIVDHPKYRSYWTKRRYYIRYGDIKEGCIDVEAECGASAPYVGMSGGN